jgi:hypothetical protein
VPRQRDGERGVITRLVGDVVHGGPEQLGRLLVVADLERLQCTLEGVPGDVVGRAEPRPVQLAVVLLAFAFSTGSEKRSGWRSLASLA